MGVPQPGLPTFRGPGGYDIQPSPDNTFAPTLPAANVTPPPAPPPLPPSFQAATKDLDSYKTGLLAAQAQAGMAGVQAYQNARNQIGAQQADALTLARQGTPGAVGLDPVVANEINRPTQQRIQALTQAEANFNADQAAAITNTQRYLGAAKEVLPIQAEQARQTQDAISRGWDRWLQLEQDRQAAAAAARGGGGGGGGGGGKAPKALTAGEITDLLTSIGGNLRSQQGQQYLDAANALLAGPGSANQYETDLTNQYYDIPITYGATVAPAPAQPNQNEIDFANQFYGLSDQGSLARAPSPDDARIHAQAYNFLLNNNQASGVSPNTVNAQGQLVHGGYVPTDAETNAAMDALRAGTLMGAAPAWAGPSAAEQARADQIAAQQARVAQTIAGLAGPRYGTYGQLGGAAQEALNAPLANYAPEAALIAAAQGYNIGPYADPVLAQGMFPLPTPYQQQQTSNQQLAQQQQTYDLLRGQGANLAAQNYYGTANPSQLGFAEQVAKYQSADAAAAARQQAEQQRQLEAASKADSAADKRAISESVDLWLQGVRAGTKVIDPTTGEQRPLNAYDLIDDMMSQGIPADRALEVATQISGSAVLTAGG